MQRLVFSLGHSTHPITKLFELLLQHSITAVADVRSSPYSRTNPHFNRDTLAHALPQQRIAYVFLGKELGARSKDTSCYLNGKVQYDRLAQTELFRHGLERIKQGSRSYRIALVCAEKDPIDCHRSILIARHLPQELAVKHILPDGSLESQEELVERLLRRFQIPATDMFRSRDHIIIEAYRRQAENIAYQQEPTENSA